MTYPHSSIDPMQHRFSLVDRYKELQGRNSHRGDRATAEESPDWESDIKFNMSTSTLDRILAEAPANKKYALIPWKIYDKMDRKSYCSKAMIELHRENGYTIVPASRHRKANLVSDRVYRQLDSHSNLNRKSDEDEMLHDQAIIIDENILMERDMEDHMHYRAMLNESNQAMYRDIGPNGKRNQQRINDRYMKMKYLKEDEDGEFDDPNTYLYSRANQGSLGY